VSRQAGQRGVALLVVLTITALATLVAAATLFELALDQRRTFNLAVATQARAYALGAEAWVGELLRRDAEDSETDDLSEDWNQRGLVLPIDATTTLTGTLIDLQGRFNVNNLVDDAGLPVPAQVAQFRRLLEVLEAPQSAALADAVLDWLDADIEVTWPGGAEDSVYLRRTPSLRPANRRITSTTELLAVEGMDAGTWARLAPHLAALPRSTALNINTATEPVLRSLASEGGARLDLSTILTRQVQAPYASVGEFATDFGATVPSELQLGVRSDWFRLLAVVSIGNTDAALYSLLARAPGGATRTVRRSVDPEP
jgi:general secretion pathway protein K